MLSSTCVSRQHNEQKNLLKQKLQLCVTYIYYKIIGSLGEKLSHHKNFKIQSTIALYHFKQKLSLSWKQLLYVSIFCGNIKYKTVNKG